MFFFPDKVYPFFSHIITVKLLAEKTAKATVNNSHTMPTYRASVALGGHNKKLA